MPAEAVDVVGLVQRDDEVAAVPPRIGRIRGIPAVGVELAVEHAGLLRIGIEVPDAVGAARSGALVADDRPPGGRFDLHARKRRRIDVDLHRRHRQQQVAYQWLLRGINIFRGKFHDDGDQVVTLLDPGRTYGNGHLVGQERTGCHAERAE